MKKMISIILVILAVVFLGFVIYKNQNTKSPETNNNQSQNQEQSQEQVQVKTQNENQEQVKNSFEIQGMKVEILKQGTGQEAKTGDVVSTNYLGTLENGTKFDSSYDRGEPFAFTLGEGKVIKGWELGILGMKVGEKRKLTIPSNLAYGDNGIPGFIPPKATLIFEVELVGIK